MSWSIGIESGRDIGYGVPAVCDHPDCEEQIDRGMSYRCGDINNDEGCGLFFCEEHLGWFFDEEDQESGQLCERCGEAFEEGEIAKPFDPKPDVAEWINHKLTDPSWQQWRDEHPSYVAEHATIKEETA